MKLLKNILHLQKKQLGKGLELEVVVCLSAP